MKILGKEEKNIIVILGWHNGVKRSKKMSRKPAGMRAACWHNETEYHTLIAKSQRIDGLG